jgi:hypothetical protein
VPGPGVQERTIRFVRAADDGRFDINETREFLFQGRSVFDLRSAVAEELEEANVHAIKLCVRAGNVARLIPLLIDLPRSGLAMDFVVLSAGTPCKKLSSFLSSLRWWMLPALRSPGLFPCLVVRCFV